MSFLEHLFYFTTLLIIGSLIVRVGWKLKYLIPLVFFGTTISVFLILAKSFPLDWEKIQFFYNGTISINELGLKLLSLACGAGGVATFLLVLVVIAIRNDVF